MTSGIAALGGPFETLTRTDPPRFAVPPAAGNCATTLPNGSVDGTSLRSALRPRPASWRRASANVEPTRSGTVTVSDDVVVVVGVLLVVPPVVVRPPDTLI